MVIWETKSLGSVGDFSKGRGVRKDEAHSGKIPCVRYGEIYTHHNYYVKNFHSHISNKVAETSRCLYKGELLFAGSGETKDEIGKCVAFIDNCEAYAGGDIVILTPRTEVDSLFLGYYLNSKPVVEQKAGRGQGDAIVHISAASLAEIEISLPPFPEQHRIAEVLFDTDALLVALEKLIAKKRAIKQGAMQELLTGKRRLSGFDGEWVKKTIAEIAPLQRGFDLPASKIINGKYPIIYSNGIGGNHNIAMAKAPGVVTGRSGTIGSLTFVKKDYFPHNTALWVTSFNDNDPLFIYYIFHLVDWHGFATGSGVPTLNRNDVHELRLPLPTDVREQRRIATILSDMDAEIDALTAKLNKLRNIKHGMMSELLTGHIRLPEQETEVVSAEGGHCEQAG